MSGPVIFAVGRRGLYRKQEALRIPISNRVDQIVIGEMLQIEYVRFSSQPPRPRGVGVGIGDETETIELGKSPVHRGIRAHASFECEYFVRSILVAIDEAVKSAVCPKEAEPWGPGMRGKDHTLPIGFEHLVYELRSGRTERGPSIAREVAIFR